MPGTRDVQGSYRSELTGLLGLSGLLWGIWTISSTATHADTPAVWDILISCDGKSALATSLLASPERLSTRYKHFDMISMIMGFWKQLPCASFPVHVKGHIDDLKSTSELSRLELLNVEVDRYAKRFAYESVAKQHPHLSDFASSHGMPVVCYQKQLISSNLYRTLHKHCTRNDLIRYWENRWGFTPSQSQAFAWSAFSRSMGGLPWYRRVFVMKWLSGQTSLGSRKRSRTHQRSCPRCPSSKDDESHCLRCMKVRPTLLTLLDALYEKLGDIGTHPHLVKGIRICTDLWLHPGRPQTPGKQLQDIHFSICNLLCDQYSFGWLRFLQGLHLEEFQSIQQSYFHYKDIHHSVEKWHSALINELWYILEKVYHHRCEALESKRSDDDESHIALVPALTAAKAELERGLPCIPVLYHQYFPHTPSTLEDLDATSLREWLRFVRLSRENLHDDLPVSDYFSPGGKYRSWLLSSS